MDRQLTRKGILFILIGPAGSGKSTICARLVHDFPESVQPVVTATTRAPRVGEVQGISYHFISRDEFVLRRERGEFFEWEETHGNLYGTLQESLLRGIDAAKDLLFQVDIRGALKFKRQFPDNTVTVFLLPPSFGVLKNRLLGRGSDGPQELEYRFKTARDEYGLLLQLRTNPNQIDYVVVNNDLDESYNQVRAIMLAERSRYLRIDKDSVDQFCEVDV